MNLLLTALMAWVAAATGLPMADVPGHVFRDKCDIAAIYQPRAPCKNVPAIALYESGVMFLPDTWNAADLYDVSIVVHELVHHLQFNAGHDMGCPSEKQAYDVQIEFLRATGLSKAEALEVMGMNKLSLLLAMTCGLRE